MKGALLVIPAGGEPYDIRYEGERPGLQKMQELVGGSIEMIPLLEYVDLADGDHPFPVEAYCNEEGKNHRLPFNEVATALWARELNRRGMQLTDVLVGPVVLVMGDKEFMNDDA